MMEEIDIREYIYNRCEMDDYKTNEICSLLIERLEKINIDLIERLRRYADFEGKIKDGLYDLLAKKTHDIDNLIKELKAEEYPDFDDGALDEEVKDEPRG